jgi:hypothetical protein
MAALKVSIAVRDPAMSANSTSEVSVGPFSGSWPFPSVSPTRASDR